MLPFEKQQRKTKLYRSFVTFFDDPIEHTASLLDYWFISPFRNAYNGTDYLPLILVILFSGLWIQVGLTATFLCLTVFTLESLAKLSWNGVNYLASELCDLEFCSLDGPFDSEKDRFLTEEETDFSGTQTL